MKYRLVFVAGVFIVLLATGWQIYLAPTPAVDRGYLATSWGYVFSAIGLLISAVTAKPAFKKQKHSLVQVAGIIKHETVVSDRDAHFAAVKDTGSDSYQTRLAGLHQLREIADRSEEWRQRSIDMICALLVRSTKKDSSDPDIVKAVLGILTDRLQHKGQVVSWKDCDFRIGECELSGAVLPSIELASGSLIFTNVTILDEGLDLSSLKLSGGATLRFENAVVRGRLNVSCLSAEGSRVEFVNSTIVGGELEISDAVISGDAELQMRRTVLSGGEVTLARSRILGGTVRMGHILAGHSAKLVLAELQIDAGSLSIDRIELEKDVFLTAGGTELFNGGRFVINEAYGDKAWFDLVGMRLWGKSLVVMHHSAFSDMRVRLNGTRVHEGSSFLLDTFVSARDLTGIAGDGGLPPNGAGDATKNRHSAGLEIESFEVNDEGSVLAIHVTLIGKDAVTRIVGGGNYGGDAHLAVFDLGSNETGKLIIADPHLYSGSIELDVDSTIDVQVSCRFPDHISSDLTIRAESRALRALLESNDRVTFTAVTSKWIDRFRNADPPYRGTTMEFSRREVDDIRSKWGD